MKKEIELKYRLKSKSDLEWLQLFLEPYASGKKITYLQENYYFDTPSFNLRRNGISLRLRKQNDDFLLCAKQSINEKKSKKEHLSVRLEYEGIVDTSVARLMHMHYVSPIEAFAILPANTDDEELTKKALYRQMKKTVTMGLQIIGSFTNERIIVPIDIDGKKIDLELDHSTYPKSIEIFEVEVEFESEKQATTIGPILETLFQKANIKTQKSCSKSSRLYKLLYRK